MDEYCQKIVYSEIIIIIQSQTNQPISDWFAVFGAGFQREGWVGFKY